MANYLFADPFLGVPAPMSATYTFATSAGINPQWPLGMEVRAEDHPTETGSAVRPSLGAGIFVHAQGSDVGTAGLLVYLKNNSAVKLAAGVNYPVGVACGVLSATNVAGWVQVAGIKDDCRGTNVSIPADVQVFVGTAGGFVVSGSVANSAIRGMVMGTASYTSSQSLSMTVQLNRPYVQFNTASF